MSAAGGGGGGDGERGEGGGAGGGNMEERRVHEEGEPHAGRRLHDLPDPAAVAAVGRVVVATRNTGKLREILHLFETVGLAFDLVTIDSIAPTAVLAENETTFEGNALAKARQAAQATGFPALADDSGLEVDALEGAPGVWSARYAGEPSDDERNNAKLMQAMAGVLPNARRARFRCVAAFVDPARGIEIARAGVCEGEILTAPRGDKGFGYDPLFFLPVEGVTMAELDLDQKNRLSHRAAAFRALATDIAATLR